MSERPKLVLLVTGETASALADRAREIEAVEVMVVGETSASVDLVAASESEVPPFPFPVPETRQPAIFREHEPLYSTITEADMRRHRRAQQLGSIRQVKSNRKVRRGRNARGRR